jgi:hypothetical protein
MITITCDNVTELKREAELLLDKPELCAGESMRPTPADAAAKPSADSDYTADAAYKKILALDVSGLQSGKDYVINKKMKIEMLGKTNESDVVGGFHTLCEDCVGLPPEHPWHGKKAGEIMPESIWFPGHQPADKNGGYAYDNASGVWWMIYPATVIDGKLYSRYAAKVANEISYEEVVGMNGNPGMLPDGARLPDDREFTQAAQGSNERTSKHENWGDFDYTTHNFTDTNGRTMISNSGLFGLCGFIWQYLDTGDAPFCVLLAGASWDNGSYCGGRARDASNSLSSAYADVGGRAVSQNI